MSRKAAGDFLIRAQFCCLVCAHEILVTIYKLAMIHIERGLLHSVFYPAIVDNCSSSGRHDRTHESFKSFGWVV